MSGTFCTALWDTLSTPQRSQKSPPNVWTPLQNSVRPIGCPVEGIRGGWVQQVVMAMSHQIPCEAGKVVLARFAIPVRPGTITCPLCTSCLDALPHARSCLGTLMVPTHCAPSLSAADAPHIQLFGGTPVVFPRVLFGFRATDRISTVSSAKFVCLYVPVTDLLA